MPQIKMKAAKMKMSMRENRNSNRKINDKRKKIMISCLALVGLFGIIVGVTVAWINNQRSLKTAASLISPYTLRIGAGSNESIEQLDMGNIDVSSAQEYKDYVICVYGNPSVPYVMQLAHTTNIGFEYEVYYASTPSDKKPDLGDFTEYTDVNDKVHYFSVVPGNTVRANASEETKLMGSENYINKEASSNVANDTLKNKETSGEDVIRGSYDTADNVQKNASALYMKSDIIYPTANENNYGEFVHYYIVRVSWKNATIKNDKETDIIYITVSANES